MMVLLPLPSGIVAVQDVVPDAVPLAPVSVFTHVTWVTVAGDVALEVPLTVIGDDAAGDGGAVTVTVGGGVKFGVV
jgi:hypothetical protein